MSHIYNMDISPWIQDLTIIPNHPLEKDMSVDVVIIGSGLTGISTAYQLRQLGKKIIVIDKADIRQSTTAYTTAFITYVIDTPLSQLINLFGEGKAEMIWHSHKTAIDTIEKIVKEENIACEFIRCPEFLYAYHKSSLSELEKEYNAAKKLGFDVRLHKGNHTPFTSFGFLEFQKQAKFHPLKYALALKKIAEENGIQFFDNTEALTIEGHNPVTVTTPHAKITAKKAIIATYDPFNHPIVLFAKRGMYTTTYVLEARIAQGLISEGLYLDMENPYHYTRVDDKDGYDRLIIGGEDHRQEIEMDPEKNFSALVAYLYKAFPDLSLDNVRKWTGPILESTDGLAYIGKLAIQDTRFVAMAFSGNGMTYATIASLMAKDFVMDQKSPWEELYSPNRIPTVKQLVEKSKDYLGEFFGGAVKNSL